MKRLLLITPLLFLTSCISFYLRDNTYKANESSTVVINGAKVNCAMDPAGGGAFFSGSALIFGGGAGRTDGPFNWRIEALGEKGVHTYLNVHSVSVKTEKTNRDEKYPAKYVNNKQPFNEMRGKDNINSNFAKYRFPGKLEVYPKKDGIVTITAEISVSSEKKTERKTVRFTLDPLNKNRVDNVFIPAEIINSFRKKDPTEWKWN